MYIRTQDSLTDLEIQAFIDGELAENEAHTIKRLIEQNHHAMNRYKQLMKQKDLLQLWWNSQEN